MNLYKIAQENIEEEVMPNDRLPLLRIKESDLVKIIEALGRVTESDDWRTLKNLVFDGVVDSLEKYQRQEAEKPEINKDELNRLHGQLVWARKFSDLNKLRDVFRKELVGVREQIKSISS